MDTPELEHRSGSDRSGFGRHGNRMLDESSDKRVARHTTTATRRLFKLLAHVRLPPSVSFGFDRGIPLRAYFKKW